MVRRNPLLVGFGIATPERARDLSQDADGVIIGSALIRKILDSADAAELRAWVRQFKNALRQ